MKITYTNITTVLTQMLYLNSVKTIATVYRINKLRILSIIPPAIVQIIATAYLINKLKSNQ